MLRLALVGAAWVTLLLLPGRAAALTCGITASMPTNSAELAIAGGWPDDPYYVVLIGIVLGIDPEQGDAGTFGETLTVQVEGVLVGTTRGRTVEIFNPPLGGSGWIGFEVDGQYLIAAYEDEEHGLLTFLCTPNQPVESRERFDQLVSLAEAPLVPDTSMVQAAPAIQGWPAVVLGVLVGFIALLRALVLRHPGGIGSGCGGVLASTGAGSHARRPRSSQAIETSRSVPFAAPSDHVEVVTAPTTGDAAGRNSASRKTFRG